MILGMKRSWGVAVRFPIADACRVHAELLSYLSLQEAHIGALIMKSWPASRWETAPLRCAPAYKPRVTFSRRALPRCVQDFGDEAGRSECHSDLVLDCQMVGGQGYLAHNPIYIS